MSGLLDSSIRNQADREKKLRELELTYEELLQRTACAEYNLEFFELAYEKLNELCKVYEDCIDATKATLTEYQNQNNSAIEGLVSVVSMELKNVLEKGGRIESSRRAKKAADARHSRPGQSRDKQRAIREIWASGKYSSRDICAEQESGALGMSFSAARKALRNTPNP